MLQNFPKKIFVNIQNNLISMQRKIFTCIKEYMQITCEVSFDSHQVCFFLTTYHELIFFNSIYNISLHKNSR